MLTATSQHALRALVHLVQLPPESPVLGRDLAERAQIPPNYLSKVLLALRNVGIVEATRGLKGGYRLARPAHEIHLIDVVEVFEGVRSKPGCLLGERHECCDAEGCSAHQSWKVVLQAYVDFLTQTTIAQLAANRGTVELSVANASPVVLQVSGDQDHA